MADATSVHMRKWLSWLVNRGHEVHLITDMPEEIEGVRVHTLTGRMGVFPFALKYLQTRRAVRRIRPDILHAHFLTGYGSWAASAGFHPLIMTAWGCDVLIDPNRSALKKLAVIYALRSADVITCAGEHMVQNIQELKGKPGRIRIIYFGTDTDKFSPKGKSLSLATELDVRGCPTIISTRNFEPIYDVETLVRAMAHIIKEVPDAKMIAIGKGSLEGYLKNLARSLNLYESIRFLGFIPNDVLPSYLALSDIYVSTSLSDAGLPVSTAEAMACELPVVTTDIKANRKWIKNGENGLIVPTENPVMLAKKIIELLNDSERRIRFGKAGREMVVKMFNLNSNMLLMEKIYMELTG
ncbi:MAG: glycosyltransferase family 4 protein [Candidatus Thermoplasmatota archaeon]